MTATFAERKLHTIELLTKLEDEELLLLIEQLLSEAIKGDWADNLSEAEKISIRVGIEQLDQGQGENMESFQKRTQAKFS